MRKLIATALIGLFLLPAAASAQVTFESLLHEMTNRDETARWPDPAYTCKQFSSYDRAAQTPGTPGWWSNDDRDQFVRVEENNGRTEYVLMDAQGPGALVRIWTTWHGKRGDDGSTEPFSDGPIRIYLDGAATPTIEAPATELIGGPHLVGPPLSESVSHKTDPRWRGHNLYLPIPYAQSCKITYETNTFINSAIGEVLYYQVNYRTYQPGTQVATFQMNDLQKHAALIDHKQTALRQSAPTVKGDLKTLNASLTTNQSASLSIDGPLAIRSLAVKLAAPDLPQALRSTVIQIEFDGKRTVWAPVGDFFAAGYQIHPYSTWFTSADENNKLACSWVMPFQQNATITIKNLGEQTVSIQDARVLSSAWNWDHRSLYFHAGWRNWHHIETNVNPIGEAGAFDLHWATVTGRGKWVGDSLTLFNRAVAWWGEGDEKIFVDGEAFPSHFGTGTEDYYGYAWCRPDSFHTPFHAQPNGNGALKPGFVNNSRFRPLDAIPFKTSIRFDMELWPWQRTTIDYAPTVFFYADADATCDIQPTPSDALLPVSHALNRVNGVVPAAIEGESLNVRSAAGGTFEVQNIDAFGWSNNSQLWWIDAQPGQAIVIDVPAPAAGQFAVYAGLTYARDYAIIDLALNGKLLQQDLDLYNPQVTPAELFLGLADLQAGPSNQLVVTIAGANPSAEARHMFGLDYLRIVQIPNPATATQ